VGGGDRRSTEEAAQAAAEAKEEADLLELEAANAAARSQGMGGCSV